MSQLIGGARPTTITDADEQRLYPAWWKVPVEIPRNGDVVGDIASYVNAYWPGNCGLYGDAGDVNPLEAVQFDLWDPALGTGASSRFGFVGVTRDQYGSTLGSCVAKLFRSSDDSKQDQTTSDPTTGAFLLNTAYYPDAHYIVFQKTGSPDVQGVTVNTLTGT